MANSYSDYKSQLDANLTGTYASNYVESSTPADKAYWMLLYSNKAISNHKSNLPDDNNLKTYLQRLAKVAIAVASTYGSKIHINSGYRSSDVNSSIPHAAPHSHHMEGTAMDLSLNNGEKNDAQLFLFFINNDVWKKRFRQIIWESGWVHISFKVENDDISKDSSYDTKGQTIQQKLVTKNEKGKESYSYPSIVKYKKTDENGYIYFVDTNSPSTLGELNGLKYNPKNGAVNYDQINSTTGDSGVSGYSDSSGGYSSSPTPVINYGGSTSRGANTVVKLSKARNRVTGSSPKTSDQRKKDFDTLAETLISSTPELGRTITKSQEMYDASILKGDQQAKKDIN